MFLFMSGRKYRNDILESCAVSTGGGMLGGYSSSSLKIEDGGRASLTVKRRETHSDREVTTVYDVDPEALRRVSEMVNEYGLYAASRRPYSKIQVLDGDSTTLSFDYSKGRFTISDNQVLSGKMSEGVREVISFLSSLAAGEGIESLEPQTAWLYLKSGYTLRFFVCGAFDGRLNGILDLEHEVSGFADTGIVLCEGLMPDLSGAEPAGEAKAGNIVYDPGSGKIILLYKDFAFDQPVYLLAELDGYISTAAPHIAEMEGAYKLQLN